MEKNQLKYMELISWIRQQIEEKQFQPGQKLYSENRLKEMFGLSRQTVRHAISVLEEEGILRRVQGSGTYINDRRQVNLESRTRISVVTTYVDSYIFPRTIQGIENVLFQHGYSVQIAFTNNQTGREKMILEDILSRDEVAGVIMETTKSGIPNPNLELYRRIRERGIPVLFLNSCYPQLDIPHVSLNDRQVGYKSTEYLIQKGHEKIGAVFKLDDGQGVSRYTGYLEALEHYSLEIEDNRVVWIDTVDIRQFDKNRERLLSRLQDCTGVVCYNDEVAFSLTDLLKKEGIKIPQDISVISVDDSELAVLLEPALTSVIHPMEKLGDKAANNLIEMIRNPAFQGTYEFEVSIVERDSVAKRASMSECHMDA